MEKQRKVLDILQGNCTLMKEVRHSVLWMRKASILSP